VQESAEIERPSCEESQRQQHEAHVRRGHERAHLGRSAKGSPSPIKKQPPPKTRAEIHASSAAEREKALAEALENTEF